MNAVVIILGSLFTLLSSIVLAYVVMVSMIGPWIAPTLVLLAAMILKMFRQNSNQRFSEHLALIQTVGSVGGVVGTALAFSLPTLYFLDPEYFQAWLLFPRYFCFVIGAACLAAGALGIYLGRFFSAQFMTQEKLSFPVSTLIYNMITSQSQGSQARQMLKGLFSTGFFCFIRDGLFSFKGLLPRTLFLFPSIFGRECAFALFTGPTLWSIGFIAGAMIATPLIVGVLSKYLILYPLNYHAHYLPRALFSPLPQESFSLAFCSGLVLSEAVLGISKYPAMIVAALKNLVSIAALKRWIGDNFSSSIVPTSSPSTLDRTTIVRFLASSLEGVVALLACLLFLSYLHFSWAAQFFLLFLTAIATYHMCYMGVKMGLLPYGRFATFVMVPTMLLFKLDYMQITFLCVFVNICGGVAADLLFDYKVGQLCEIPQKRVHAYQWFGLIVTSLGMGFFLWLLFTNFQLGSPELFAQRGKTRALLIQSTDFNVWVVAIGFLFGWILNKLKVNPALTLGGILMPNSISIGLIIGGLLSKVVKNTERFVPFWSGVFASESLWILISMFVKLAGW